MESNIQRERLSAKRMRDELKSNFGTLDTTLTDKYLNDTYLLKDGKVIVSFGTHGFLYNSVKEFEQWEDDLKKSFQEKSPSHILVDKLLYGKEFPLHINSLIDSIKVTLSLDIDTISLESLKEIDKRIKMQRNEIMIDKYLFSEVVAFAGEVMRKNLFHADWEMVNSKFDKSIWEPYVLSEGKRYNPFFPVYRELYEDLSETGHISIYDRVKIELGQNK
jgi:hypothetical protein